MVTVAGCEEKEVKNKCLYKAFQCRVALHHHQKYLWTWPDQPGGHSLAAECSSVADSIGKEECLEGRSELLFLVFIVGLLCPLQPYINCAGLSASLRKTYLQGIIAPGWESSKQISQATLVSWSLTLFSFATSKLFNAPSGPIKGQFIRKCETNLILWGIWMHLLNVFVKYRPPVRLERKCDYDYS